MKLYFNKKYTTIALYAFLVLAAGILFVALIFNLTYFTGALGFVIKLITPFVYGFVIAYLLNPLMNWIDRTVFTKFFKNKAGPRLRRASSLTLTYLVALGLIVLFLWAIIPQVIASVSVIWNQFPGYIKSLESWVSQSLPGSGIDQGFLEELFSKLASSFEQIMQQVYSMLGHILPALVDLTTRLTTGIVNFVLGAIISMYMLYRKERFAQQSKKLLYAFLPRKQAGAVVDFAHTSHSIFSGFINGKILDSLIIGILCFVCMTLIGFPYPTLNSLIIGVTNVIPYFGPIIGAIPSAIIVLMAKPEMTIWFLLFVLILQQFDGNILGPKILGQSTGISAFWVIFAIMLFGGLFGFIGMFIGVPTFAVLYSLIRSLVHRLLKKKNLPIQGDVEVAAKTTQISLAEDEPHSC